MFQQGPEYSKPPPNRWALSGKIVAIFLMLSVICVDVLLLRGSNDPIVMANLLGHLATLVYWLTR